MPCPRPKRSPSQDEMSQSTDVPGAKWVITRGGGRGSWYRCEPSKAESSSSSQRCGMGWGWPRRTHPPTSRSWAWAKREARAIPCVGWESRVEKSTGSCRDAPRRTSSTAGPSGVQRINRRRQTSTSAGETNDGSRWGATTCSQSLQSPKGGPIGQPPPLPSSPVQPPAT